MRVGLVFEKPISRQAPKGADEVLNFLNRHRDMADGFYAFIQNLTVALTGATKAAAVISLPRSQVEMTDWDTAWQEKISKVVRRVSKDLIVNDESEIGDVIRRRLFENTGKEAGGKKAAKTYADWCFERRNQLPPEWTAVDTSATETKARDFLKSRFEACFPFHPATLSVFQRKWQSLSQFQQNRSRRHQENRPWRWPRQRLGHALRSRARGAQGAVAAERVARRRLHRAALAGTV